MSRSATKHRPNRSCSCSPFISPRTHRRPQNHQQPTKHRRRAGTAASTAKAATSAPPSSPSPAAAPPSEVIALFQSALAEFPHAPPEASDARRATADARRSSSRAPTVSALQQEVSLALEALGLAGLMLEVDDEGVFQYDFVVDPASAGAGKTVKKASASSPLPLLPVVVEVDGSPHFFVNDLQQPLGDTRFKRRLVRAQVRASSSVRSASIGVS